jgi:SET domain-containing protein
MVLKLKSSKIHGLGIHTLEKVLKDTEICKVFIEDENREFEETLYGSYANHQAVPNTRLELKKNTIVLVASKDIEKDNEITTNYRDLLVLNIKIKYNELIDYNL